MTIEIKTGQIWMNRGHIAFEVLGANLPDDDICEIKVAGADDDSYVLVFKDELRAQATLVSEPERRYDDDRRF